MTAAIPLALGADTATDLMRGDVASLETTNTFAEALAFFIDRNVTVAPVTDSAGRPVGVLSVTDLLIHVRACESTNKVVPATVASMMTPTVFTVRDDTPAAEVVHDMLRSKVHHLFVTDAAGDIVGVVSTCDVLKHLQ
jgi:predicted transcriptional regulator